jgi:uncharacterized membrane protein YeaQ/YmgE (transglycosylase-associated protein family)
MDTITFLVVGLVVGFAASRIVPGRRDETVGRLIVIGILGAFGGAMIAQWMGYAIRDTAAFLASILGAVALVAGYMGIVTRRMA